MPELRKVDGVEWGACFLCGGDRGPFVDVGLDEAVVHTPNGPFPLVGRVAFCDGCCVQLGTMAGCLTAEEAQRQVQQHDGAVAELLARVEELQEKLDEAVPRKDLERLLKPVPDFVPAG